MIARTRVALKKPGVRYNIYHQYNRSKKKFTVCGMATIHSQQLARKLFPKLACSALLALLLGATVLLSGAFYQNRTTFHNKLVPTNFLNRLFATGRSEKVEMAALTGLHSQDSKTMVK